MNIFALALKERHIQDENHRKAMRLVPEQRKRLSEMLAENDEFANKEYANLVASCRGNPYLRSCPIPK